MWLTGRNSTAATCSCPVPRVGFRRKRPADFASKLALQFCGPNRSPRHISAVCTRLLLLFAFWSLLFALAAATEAKETCPWLNEATAAGFLGGSVTSTVTFAIKDKTDANYSKNDKNDATCEFVRHQGSLVMTLRIEVETMTGPSDSFASHVARCGPHAAPLRAVGNEAVACGFDGRKNQVSEQVVSRVRGRAFTVRITSNSDSLDRGVLRDKTRNVAEQVAGFLF
jgi:hypothetical protein